MSKTVKPQKHVVAFSGGKDSTAMALRLKQMYPNIGFEYVSTPTGDELPEMTEHIKTIEKRLQRSVKVLGKKTLSELIEYMEMIPNFRMRWCTRIIKIEPFIEYMESLGPGSIMYVGLRADESGRLGLIQPGAQFEVKCPLQEWGWKEPDVWNYLSCQGVSIPRRTDCARCFYNRLSEWYLLWLEHPDIYADAEEQEKRYGHTFRSPQRDSWPAALSDLRIEFERQRIPKAREKQNKSKCRFCTM